MRKIEVRFWKGFAVQKDGCWIWKGVKPGAYGRLWEGKTRVLVHRFSYEIHKGPVPEGLEIDHLCRERRCVNPDHLEAVTQRVNILRGMGTPAQNARLTMCRKGHPLSGENLYLYPNGRRRCRTCQRAGQERFRRAHRG